MKMLSEEWIKKCTEKGYETFAESSSPTGISVTLCEVYEEVPHLESGLMWNAFTLEDGVLKNVEYGYDRSGIPVGFDFICFSKYEDVIKILKGEVPLAKAAVNGMVKIQGNMFRAMKMLGTYQELMKIKKLDGETEY